MPSSYGISYKNGNRTLKKNQTSSGLQVICFIQDRPFCATSLFTERQKCWRIRKVKQLLMAKQWQVDWNLFCLQREKEKIVENRRQVKHLVSKSKETVRLKPRNPEEKNTSGVIVKALCDFKQDQVSFQMSKLNTYWYFYFLLYVAPTFSLSFILTCVSCVLCVLCDLWAHRRWSLRAMRLS